MCNQEFDIAELNYLLKLNDEKPIHPPPRYIAEYIENNRILPSNTPIPGPWKNWRSQYAVEIMDCMSPWNPTQHVDVMSASQVVKTSLMENVIGYYMGACPAPILFMSGTDSLLDKWMSKRLEPLIDSIGVRKKFHASIERDKSRASGDKARQKLYTGGFLEVASAQSPSSQRSDSIRVLCMDELDAAPPLLTTGEGYWDENAEARTKAWGNRRKILACSTPTEFHTSTIYRRFMLGDQCEYFVPCPICGKFQLLERGSEKGSHGLRTETKNGAIEFVYYLCEFCHDAIFEHQKNEMIRGGRWEPQAKAERLRRSFHLNALLSPLGLYSWTDYIGDLIRAERTPDGMRVFTNHQDGRPFIASGTRPKPEKILENKGKYKSGTVPEGVLYITIGIDVQRGSSNDPENPPRIEGEILGIGYGYRTWSINYFRFEGAINDPYSGAWDKLHNFALDTNFIFKREIDGFEFPVSLVFIDSGDGENTDVVYRFCQRWSNTFPIKGQRSIAMKKGEKPDEMTDQSFRRYKPSKLGEDNTIYIISTVYYKNQIYNNLKIDRQEFGDQKPGFCDFPVEYGEKYFDMLTAEEKMADGSFQGHGRRNEALDCFDGETEILTDQGWKYFYELNKTENVATVNLEKDEIEYQKPIEYIHRHHNGEMIHIKGQRIDILTTPKHRMIASKKQQEIISRKPYKRKWNLNTPFEVVLAEDLTIHHQLKNSSNWKKEIKNIIIPEYVSKHGILISGKKEINSHDWAAFLGFYVAEGCKAENYNKKTRCNNYRVQLDQNEGSKAEKLRLLLDRLPWNFREEKQNGIAKRWTCNEKQLYLAISDCGENVYSKKIPEWVKNQDMSVIQTFLEWAIIGDGHVNKHGHRSYYTVSPKLADDIQELFIKSGTSARIDYHHAKPYKPFSGSKNCDGTNTVPQYHVRESRFERKSLDGGKNGKRECLAKKIEWNGMVYCVSVPNKTLILRRNGISFMAGNCRVYALCAGDVFLDSEVLNYRTWAKERGLKQSDILSITRRTVIDKMIEQTAIKKIKT